MKRLLVLFLFVALQTKPMDWFSKAMVQSATNESNSGSGIGSLVLKTGAFLAVTAGSTILWDKAKGPLERKIRERLGLPVQPSVQELQAQVGALQRQVITVQDFLKAMQKQAQEEEWESSSSSDEEPTPQPQHRGRSRIADLAVSMVSGSPMIGRERVTEPSKQESSSDSDGHDDFSSPSSDTEDTSYDEETSAEKSKEQAVYEKFLEDASRHGRLSSSSSEEDLSKSLEEQVRKNIREGLARRSASNPSLRTLAKNN